MNKMEKSLPLEKVNVAGVIYDVVWVDEAIREGNVEHWALLDAEHRKLSVYKGLSEHDLKHLFCHEFVHEILNMIGDLSTEEPFIKVFSRLLFDAVDRNHIFTRKVKP